MANQAEEMSRAEKVRARRKNNRTKKPKTTVGSSATRKPKSQHATVTRRSSGTVPVVTRKKHTAYVPLKNKGAELQIPAFPTLQLGWRLISGAIMLLSLAVVFSFTTLSTFKISSINLRGAERLSPEAILLQLDLAGTSIIRVEPEQIKAQIEDQFPSVKSVSVSVGLPSSVTIQVEERVPVVLWEQENSTYWIDAEGVMFPAIGEVEVTQSVVAIGDPPPAPEVFTPEIDDETGEISHLLENRFTRTTPEFVSAVLSLRDYLPEETALQYDPQFGLGWQDPNSWLVYFGQDTVNIDTKLAEYQMIIEALEKQNITPTLISLEFLHAPYYRLE